MERPNLGGLIRDVEAKPLAAPLIVETDDLIQRLEHTVVHVRRGAGDVPERWSLEGVSIGPVSGHRVAAQIGIERASLRIRRDADDGELLGCERARHDAGGEREEVAPGALRLAGEEIEAPP